MYFKTLFVICEACSISEKGKMKILLLLFHLNHIGPSLGLKTTAHRFVKSELLPLRTSSFYSNGHLFQNTNKMILKHIIPLFIFVSYI